MNIKSQDTSVWQEFWKGRTPESEIKAWDHYGGRQWIFKYVPRNGKTIEAGCGLGRYVFYFSHLGIEIEGIDFAESLIEKLNNWADHNNFNCTFKKGNVKSLPYENNSLNGYISLGVIEHFEEGPVEVLNEALRILKPGGIAIITTPNKTPFIRYGLLKDKIKRLLRIGVKAPFFQYYYTPADLKRFLNKTKGFHLSVCKSFDLYNSLRGHFGLKNELVSKISASLEDNQIGNFGAHSLVIAVKKGELMDCFYCGRNIATISLLKKYDVPVCEECSHIELMSYYRRGNSAKYASAYLLNPEIMQPQWEKCSFCGKEYTTSYLFENNGFKKSSCERCLRDKNVNLLLSNKYINPIWRPL